MEPLGIHPVKLLLLKLRLTSEEQEKTFLGISPTSWLLERSIVSTYKNLNNDFEILTDKFIPERLIPVTWLELEWESHETPFHLQKDEELFHFERKDKGSSMEALMDKSSSCSFLKSPT
ncbi:hypothetical protein L1987_84434 [Smallanthus sonchifolius]|uniref:Uncharacterized protein n=1 Tax=Smallanthus sonchifolius TaxID=185202 RepID=A0ACB8YDW9_9ASTR|nr:hypothetical protein L1987_84434 [Smallanthus sonchifolius]